jgi:O-antigen ligase
MAGGRRWLRAYGLTPHPNLLGGLLGLGLLLCIGAWLEKPKRVGWLVVSAVSGIALFFSFSRSAWLGFILAVIYIVILLRPWQKIKTLTLVKRRHLYIILIGVCIIAVIFVVVFYRLLFSRLMLIEQTLESNSVAERLRDAGQAWMLIRHLPFRGVGTGYYVQALWAWANATGQDYPAFQPVHNIPLLITAEMGIGGLIIWIWLLIAPPVWMLKHRKKISRPLNVFWTGVFVLLFTINMFDNYLYIPKVWWPSIYIGLLYGGWVRQSILMREHADEANL